MGKVYNNKKCLICGTMGRVKESWGKFYCLACDSVRPKKSGGHGGLVDCGACPDDYLSLTSSPIWLEQVPKGHPLFATWFLRHYPASRGIMGRCITYLIFKDNRPVCIIGGNSPPKNYKKFRTFFDTDNDESFVNNNVFRIVETTGDKNFGTKVLKLFRKTISVDYLSKYKEPLVGIVTFVEPPRSGAIYRADNWSYLGQTQGITCKKRDFTKWTNKEWSTGLRKHIFAIKLPICYHNTHDQQGQSPS